MRQRFPAWLPKVLLSATAALLTATAALSVVTYKLATRPVQLEDLSAAQRRQLLEQANKIAPPIYQPLPLAGPMLFYHMTPNTRYVNVFHATFTTNDVGFRAVPTSPKPDGVKRIVVVGDSWTFGQGVEADETFTSQLEKLLTRKGGKWQVYNLGMPGWNTANQLAALRTLFSRVKPDVVVFCPTSNDIDDSYEVWNGRLLPRGFASTAGFRRSYGYESRWIQVFRDLQREVDSLKGRGIPSLIYFLAEWHGLAPYYARLASLHVPYTVVPTEYLRRQYRLSSELDPGQHATPEGHRLIAAYLHNALLEQRIVTSVDALSIGNRVVFPGQAFDPVAVEAEFKHWAEVAQRPESTSSTEDFIGREAMFSVAAPASARIVTVQLKLIDDPGLYPLTVEVRLESRERIASTRLFDRFLPQGQTIEVTKPRSLDRYPIIEVHVTADHVVVPRDLTPVSMHRPSVEVR